MASLIETSMKWRCALFPALALALGTLIPAFSAELPSGMDPHSKVEFTNPDTGGKELILASDQRVSYAVSAGSTNWSVKLSDECVKTTLNELVVTLPVNDARVFTNVTSDGGLTWWVKTGRTSTIGAYNSKAHFAAQEISGMWRSDINVIHAAAQRIENAPFKHFYISQVHAKMNVDVHETAPDPTPKGLDGMSVIITDTMETALSGKFSPAGLPGRYFYTGYDNLGRFKEQPERVGVVWTKNDADQSYHFEATLLRRNVVGMGATFKFLGEGPQWNISLNNICSLSNSTETETFTVTGKDISTIPGLGEPTPHEIMQSAFIEEVVAGEHHPTVVVSGKLVNSGIEKSQDFYHILHCELADGTLQFWFSSESANRILMIRTNLVDTAWKPFGTIPAKDVKFIYSGPIQSQSFFSLAEETR